MEVFLSFVDIAVAYISRFGILGLQKCVGGLPDLFLIN